MFSVYMVLKLTYCLLYVYTKYMHVKNKILVKCLCIVLHRSNIRFMNGLVNNKMDGMKLAIATLPWMSKLSCLMIWSDCSLENAGPASALYSSLCFCLSLSPDFKLCSHPRSFRKVFDMYSSGPRSKLCSITDMPG